MLNNDHALFNSSYIGLHMSTNYSDSDSFVSPPVTCVDTVTVNLHSQWSMVAASLHAGGGDSVKAGPEGEGLPTREEEEEEEEGEKMQANPAYLLIAMNYKSQESKYINVLSWRGGQHVHLFRHVYLWGVR